MLSGMGEWKLCDLERDPHELKSVYDHAAYAELRGALEAEPPRLRELYDVEGS
jgi:hypothetical protein